MKSLQTINRQLVLVTLIFAVSACATIFNSKQPTMEIQTTPPGAKVRVGENIINCTSPCKENLATVESLPVLITMPGHSEFRGTISRNISGYFWINGILGLTGLVGMGVDYLTDSMWAWEDFSVVLAPFSESDEIKGSESEEKVENEEEESSKAINEPKDATISSSESNPPSQTREQPLNKSVDGKEDQENSSAKKESYPSSSQQNNEIPFPSEAKPTVPSSNPSNPFSPSLSAERSETSPKRNESKPKLEEKSISIETAASRYPKELVVRRLEWHLGALSDEELKERTACVYQVLDRHEGGSALSLDDAILLVEDQKEICN